MDCAKGVGARLACPNKTLNDMKGLLKINHKIPLLIAIPTTAGTGSEATLSAVITDEKTHFKYPINDFDLIPNYALLDAKLTLGLPKEMTATSGMDALTHAIEAYIGQSTTKQTRSLNESIWIPNFFSCSVRFIVEAILPSNISQKPATIRQIRAILKFPLNVYVIPVKPNTAPIYVRITV